METNKNEVKDQDVALLVWDIVGRNKFAKEEMCKDEAMSDVPALFLCVWESDDDDENHDSALDYQQKHGFSKPYQVGMIPLLHKADAFEALKDVIKQMPIQKFSYIFSSAEGYMDTAKDQRLNDDPNYERGGLEKDFLNNINTTVREGLVLCGTNWKGDKLYTASCTYTYNDSGVPVFDDMEIGEQDVTLDDITGDKSFGRFADALLATTVYMHRAVKAQDFHNLMLSKPSSKDEQK